MNDIALEAFFSLRRQFFSREGIPVPFRIRPKRNTQDDPFDELLANKVFSHIPGIQCVKAPGPLITPDIVLYRPLFCKKAAINQLYDDSRVIVSIEVKKLERSSQGTIARASGLDYNTTAPCGHVRIYDAIGKTLDIRSFYLFVCLEPHTSGQVVLTALSLVDGNIINSDFEFYISVIAERKKRIGLGSYGDGADRDRPMLIFSNPLGASEIDRKVTLIHSKADLARSVQNLRLIYEIKRTKPSGSIYRFYCYSTSSDVPNNWAVTTLKDPFPTPIRDVYTRPRGRFKLPIKIG